MSSEFFNYGFALGRDMGKKLETDWHRLAKFWYKFLSVAVTHISSESIETKYYFTCPHSDCEEKLSASNPEELIKLIEGHLRKDKERGLIK